jgi:transcription antitermination factor NusA-like protein
LQENEWKMKTELCSFCLKSGILCQKCSAKVKAGEISKLDLRIARLLLSLEEKYPSLQNVCFYKAVEVEKTLAILVGHGDVPRLLGYGGKIIKALGDETGKNVRVLEYGVDDRKFLEDLFTPFSILTINTIWLPDGTTETRVILKRKRGARLPFDLRALKEIASKVRKMSLRVEIAD